MTRCEQCLRVGDVFEDPTCPVPFWLCQDCLSAEELTPRGNSPLDARRKTLEPNSDVGDGSAGSATDAGSHATDASRSRHDREDREIAYRARLEELCDAGRLEPWDVPLPIDGLPRQAAALRELVERIERWMGLRLAYGDFRAVPLSRTFVAELMDWRDGHGRLDRTRAREALRGLARYGVIVPAGETEPYGAYERGALLFRPPEPLATELGYELADAAFASEYAVEREPRGVERTVS